MSAMTIIILTQSKKNYNKCYYYINQIFLTKTIYLYCEEIVGLEKYFF